MENTTNFFTKLLPLLMHVDVAITITKAEGDKITVVFRPVASSRVKDKAMENLRAIHATGTADEFDAHFFETIKEPMESVQSLVKNLTEFEAAQAKAEKESKIQKEAKEKEKKEEAAIDKDADAVMKAIEENKDQPLKGLESIKKFEARNSGKKGYNSRNKKVIKLKELKAELIKKTSTGTLFN